MAHFHVPIKYQPISENHLLTPNPQGSVFNFYVENENRWSIQLQGDIEVLEG